jgi:hypothetical protein
MRPRLAPLLALLAVLALFAGACDEQGRTEPGTPAPFTESPIPVEEPPPAGL